MAYTKEQEARLIELGTIRFEDLEEVSAELGKSPRSIVAKVLSMAALGEDVTYVAKEKAPKRPAGMTKAEMVALIAEGVGLESIPGLEKAKGTALAALLTAVS